MHVFDLAGRLAAMAGAVLAAALTGPAAQAQTTSSPSAPAGSTAPSGSTSTSTPPPSPAGAQRGAFGVQSDPSPYYIGINQALTHDSNVFRIPSGPSDNYSSTTLLAGFDQPISRQRVYGSASVSANRYQRQDELNNTSYALNAGLDWQTIAHLSGNVNTSLGRSLSAPAATASSPAAVRNIANTRNIDATARWGGVSLLTLEGNVGWSRVDYSAPESLQGESRQRRGGLTLFYSPGGPLRLGVGGHVNRTDNPNAFLDPATGTYVSSSATAKSADLLADYRISGLLSSRARVSYTKQTSSGAGNADFSGLTGSFSLEWRPTGKTTVSFDAARDAGVDASQYTTLQVVNNNGVLTLEPAVGLLQNNRTTDTIGIAATHATTSRINVYANARYSRQKLATSAFAGTTGAPTTDVDRVVALGANYEIRRFWSLGCTASHDWRDVSGGANFSYTATTVSCSTQLTLR